MAPTVMATTPCSKYGVKRGASQVVKNNIALLNVKVCFIEDLKMVAKYIGLEYFQKCIKILVLMASILVIKLAESTGPILLLEIGLCQVFRLVHSFY